MNGESDDESNADKAKESDEQEPDQEDEREEANSPKWTKKHWLKPGRGRKLFLFDIIATVGLGIVLAVIAVNNSNGSNGLSFEITLATVSGFALMGGFGYLYTPFFKKIDRPTIRSSLVAVKGELTRFNLSA